MAYGRKVSLSLTIGDVVKHIRYLEVGGVEIGASLVRDLRGVSAAAFAISWGARAIVQGRVCPETVLRDPVGGAIGLHVE